MSVAWVSVYLVVALNIVALVYGYGRITERVAALLALIAGVQQDIRELRALIMKATDRSDK